jgi:GNAT superfamily N-acetyltransferase
MWFAGVVRQPFGRSVSPVFSFVLFLVVREQGCWERATLGWRMGQEGGCWTPVVATSTGVATPEDLAAICGLDADVLGRDERCRLIEEAVEAGTCFVGRIDGDLAGYAILDRSLFGQPFLALLVVARRCRRRGVASALVRLVEERVDGDRLFTSTNRSNDPMRRLCERLGFVASGYIENLDPGDPELIFVKWLRAPTTDRT